MEMYNRPVILNLGPRETVCAGPCSNHNCNTPNFNKGANS